MPTKDELEQENADLRQELADLKAAGGGNISTGRAAARKPQRLTDGNGNVILSAGEADDLANNGVTISPFTGETLNALDEGIEPANPEAMERAKRDKRDRQHEKRDATPPPTAPPAP